MNNDLKGLKVLELATILAGPSVGMFFAELGAYVTKIENPRTKGDVTRHWKQKSEASDVNYSAYFASVNWGKEHLFLDLSEYESLKKVKELAKESDLIISNFRPGQAERFGLDYDSIKAFNSNVVYGHISGFGEEDGRLAFDVVSQAESGYMFMNGQAAAEPTKMPVALMDILAAHQLKEGLLLALYNRERMGKGSYVSVSLLDAAVSSLVNQATNWLMNGHIPQRIGSLHPNIAPYGEMVTSSDGKQIVLAVGTQQQFASLCKVFHLDELIEDERFNSNQNRVVHRSELNELLIKKAGLYASNELMNLFLENAVPAGIIKNMKEVFEDENAKSSILTDKMNDGKEAKRVAQVAFKLS